MKKNKTSFDYNIVYNSVLSTFKNNGFNIVDDVCEANYVVFIHFKVGGPHSRTINHMVPITGQVGVDTHTTYTYGPYGSIPYTYTTPKYGTVGYDHYQTSETFYTHLLSIDVYSFSKTNLELLKKVWQVVSVTSSNSNDFRESLSALILVLGKYMATDTHGNIDV